MLVLETEAAPSFREIVGSLERAGTGCGRMGWTFDFATREVDFAIREGPGTDSFPSNGCSNFCYPVMQ
jgi:hypothetical protein